MLSRRTSFVSILYKAEEEPTVTIPNTLRTEPLWSEDVVLTAFVESPLRGLNNISNLCTWQKHPQDPADPDAGDWVDVTSNLSTTNGKLTHTITKLDVATFNSKFRVKVGGSTLNGTNYGTYVTSQNVIFEDLDERI